MSDLEHKLFTKLKKKKQADQLKLAELKEGSEVPRLDDHLQASITCHFQIPVQQKGGTVKFNNPEPGTRQFKLEISGAIGVFVVFLVDW